MTGRRRPARTETCSRLSRTTLRFPRGSLPRARSRARGPAQQRSCVDVPGGLARIRQGRRSGKRSRVLDFGRDLGRHGAFHLGVERDAKFLAETANWIALLPLFEFTFFLAIAELIVESRAAVFAPAVG